MKPNHNVFLILKFLYSRMFLLMQHYVAQHYKTNKSIN